jgi:hypothetical protein
MPNSTTIHIPPAAQLGEIAYRTWSMQVTTDSSWTYATWQQLDDDDRHPWMMAALVVAEAVRKANERADA